MATVHVESTKEEQRSVVRLFCGQEDSLQRIFTKKRFLFLVRSVCSVMRFTTGMRVSQERSNIADDVRSIVEVAETRVERGVY
jgi:hypothetical protein